MLKEQSTKINHGIQIKCKKDNKKNDGVIHAMLRKNHTCILLITCFLIAKREGLTAIIMFSLVITENKLL